MHLCIYIYTYIYIFIYIRIYTYIYIYSYVYIYVYVYTHIHVYRILLFVEHVHISMRDCVRDGGKERKCVCMYTYHIFIIASSFCFFLLICTTTISCQFFVLSFRAASYCLLNMYTYMRERKCGRERERERGRLGVCIHTIYM